MDVYDLIMLAVVAIGTLFGAWKGLAWQVASLGSIFASYFIAYRFREPVAELISASPPWNTFLAMLILYLGASLVIWMAFRFISDIIDRVKLKEFDRHTGAVLGFCRGVLWCVIITLFAVTLLGDAQKKVITESRSGYYIAVLLDRSCAIMPDEIHEVLAPYIHTLDDQLPGEHRTAHQRNDAADRLAGAQEPTPTRSENQTSRHADASIGTEDAPVDVVDRWLGKLQQSRFDSRRR